MRYLPLFLCLACAGVPELDGTQQAAPAPVDRSDEQPDAVSLKAQVAELLEGTFRSDEQAEQDRRYFDISMRLCRVDAEAYGTHVLYIEQARSDQLDSPYRQRLYVLHGTEYEVISEVWSSTQAAQWVGLCDRDERVVEEVTLSSNPAVRSSLSPPKRTSLRAVPVDKAAAAPWRAVVTLTAEVRADADGLTSWDRGYNAQDQQVWGAEADPIGSVASSVMGPQTNA